MLGEAAVAGNVVEPKEHQATERETFFKDGVEFDRWLQYDATFFTFLTIRVLYLKPKKSSNQ